MTALLHVLQVKYILGFSISMGASTRLQDYLHQYFSKMNQMRWQEYIMGVTFIFILIAFKEGQRFWKPLRHIRSLGALFVSICGVCAVYLGIYYHFNQYVWVEC